MFNSVINFKPFESLLRFFSTFDFWAGFVNFCKSFDGFNENMIFKIAQATDDTIFMIFFSSLGGIIIGLPVGILLYTTRKNNILACAPINAVASFITNIFRSIPFIILIVWIIPFTYLSMEMLTGAKTFLGKQAAVIPLSVGVSPLIARMIENALLEVPKGLIEAAKSMGATSFQIVRKVLLVEALPSIVNSMTITLITLTGYIAMAGAVGAGGLGQLAIQSGYQSYKPAIMNTVIVILIVLIYLIQLTGNKIVRRIDHR